MTGAAARSQQPQPERTDAHGRGRAAYIFQPPRGTRHLDRRCRLPCGFAGSVHPHGQGRNPAGPERLPDVPLAERAHLWYGNSASASPARSVRPAAHLRHRDLRAAVRQRDPAPPLAHEGTRAGAGGRAVTGDLTGMPGPDRPVPYSLTALAEAELGTSDPAPDAEAAARSMRSTAAAPGPLPGFTPNWPDLTPRSPGRPSSRPPMSGIPPIRPPTRLVPRPASNPRLTAASAPTRHLTTTPPAGA